MEVTVDIVLLLFARALGCFGNELGGTTLGHGICGIETRPDETDETRRLDI